MSHSPPSYRLPSIDSSSMHLTGSSSPSFTLRHRGRSFTRSQNSHFSPILDARCLFGFTRSGTLASKPRTPPHKHVNSSRSRGSAFSIGCKDDSRSELYYPCGAMSHGRPERPLPPLPETEIDSTPNSPLEVEYILDLDLELDLPPPYESGSASSSPRSHTAFHKESATFGFFLRTPQSISSNCTSDSRFDDSTKRYQRSCDSIDFPRAMRPSFQPVVRDAEDQNLLGLRLRSSEYHPHFLDSPESRTQTLVSTPPPSSCSSRPSERLRRLAPPPLYIPEASFFMDSDTHLVTTSTAAVKEPVTALNFPVSATSRTYPPQKQCHPAQTLICHPVSDYTYDKLIMNNESNESPLSFHLSLEGMQPEQTAGLPLDPPPLRRVQALSLPPITPAPVYGWGPVPSTYFGTDDGYNRIPTPEVEFDLDLELTVDDSIVTHETSPPQTERVLSPLNLHFPNPSEDLEDRISKCVDAVEWIRLVRIPQCLHCCL